MRALVVHESWFGNTRSIAEAIASGLHGTCDVTVVRAADVTLDSVLETDLLILGAPTQVHGLPGPMTRRGASAKYAVPKEIETAPGIRELLDRLPARERALAAAFDTRFRGPAWLMGSAAKRIVRRLRSLGCDVVVPAESFLLAKRRSQGPLAEGELARASAWAAEIVRRAQRAGSGALVA